MITEADLSGKPGQAHLSLNERWFADFSISSTERPLTFLPL